jgi:hypothetical protein
MGTKFRTMLAPINRSTGDGRRFQTGGIELAPTPFPFEWVRSREGGHDGAVTVGAVQETSIASVADALAAGWVTPDEVKTSGLDKSDLAIWASGVMFDDADRDEMPTLAEDVAHSMFLIGEGTLGPSVDLDSFEGIPVREGTDEEITWDDIEQAELSGEELKIELLVTQGRVRAGTLVSIPAFMETSRPLALIKEELAEASGDVTALAAQDPDTIGAAARECAAETAALIASVGAAPARPAAALFDMPALTGPTPITFDEETGRVYGHVALFGSCHGGFKDVCVTVPQEDESYAYFNRFPVDTDGGVIWAGRLTVGGRHPGLALTASGTMSAYDGKTVAADVRAGRDEFGIVISGVRRPDLDEATKRVLARRKVSGDWRETPAGLSLLEILALSPGPRVHSEPGFPVSTHVTAGRQTALVASLGPDADTVSRIRRVPELVDTAALAAAVVDEQERRARRAALSTELAELVNAKPDPYVAAVRAALNDALRGD